MLSKEEKFELANDINFTLAMMDAESGREPLNKFSFNTIGDRVRLLDKLEESGFVIIKTPKNEK